jgi:type III secretion protein S
MRQILFDAVMVAMILSAIPMVVIALVSGFVALIQAATQIQEQSVSHLVKLGSFLVVALIAGDWASSEILSLFERCIDALDIVEAGAPR